MDSLDLESPWWSKDRRNLCRLSVYPRDPKNRSFGTVVSIAAVNQKPIQLQVVPDYYSHMLNWSTSQPKSKESGMLLS